MFKTGFVQGLDGKVPSPLSGIGSPTDIPGPGPRPALPRQPAAFGPPAARDPLTGKLLRRSAPIVPISTEELAAVRQMVANPAGISSDQLLVAGPFIHSFPFPGYNPAKHQAELDDGLVHLVARPHYAW